MPYEKMKIYFDGSHQHYIGIPHTTRPTKERYKKVEELVTVIEDEKKNNEIEASSTTFADTNEEAEISIENIAVIEDKAKSKVAKNKLQSLLKLKRK